MPREETSIITSSPYETELQEIMKVKLEQTLNTNKQTKQVQMAKNTLPIHKNEKKVKR